LQKCSGDRCTPGIYNKVGYSTESRSTGVGRLALRNFCLNFRT